MKALLELCAKVGSKVPTWTQGAGGNISLKKEEAGEELLWIKATGLRLDSIREGFGLASLKRQPFLKWCANVSPLVKETDAENDYAKAINSFRGQPADRFRPSMETGFHAVLPGRYVAHFHSLAALLMAYQHKTKPTEWEGLFARAESTLRVCFLPALRPGWLLTQAIARAPHADAYVLDNHGVILQGDTSEILLKWSWLEEKFCQAFGYSLTPDDPETEIPLRLYFPDTAVFLDRLMPLLRAFGKNAGGETLYRFERNALDTQRDLAEIWQATQILYREQPDLPELPAEISRVVSTLPTETLRRAVVP